ncbi:MAG TPA: sulfatase [Candidatus Dormibacteraeota bacterium]|jgi:arylsulfatase A-like enzyme|nr:sulfatase [Candidatus Dormibacteraeota bacterium]
MKVLLVSLDTVRADHLSCYGYGRPTSPNIDAVAAEGARFARAFPSDIPTQPSHTALFTGQIGLRTGIVSHFWPPAQLAPTVPWLPQILEREGVTTGAIDNLVNMKEWFVRGYEQYLKPRGRTRALGTTVNQLALPWLEAHAAEDFFCFVHYWDAHIPYLPPSPQRERFTAGLPARPPDEVRRLLEQSPAYPLFKQRHYDLLGEIPSLDHIAGLYDAEIATVDERVGELVRHLQRLGIYDDTMVILLGDHGENMAEHDAWWDHATLYDSVVHVPLIVRFPPRVAPRVVDPTVILCDVMPTVLELADVDARAPLHGRSLWPLLRGGADWEARRELVLSECTWEAKRAIRTDEWKYIHCYDPGVYGRPEPELYDLRVDPAERRNVAGQHPEVAADLRARLLNRVETELDGRQDPIDEVVRSELPAVTWLRQVVAEIEVARPDPATP